MASETRVERPPSIEDPAGAAVAESLMRVVADNNDILRLAQPEHPGFTVASRDDRARITMLTMPVPGCPIVMMKARAVMPCSPDEFLRYLDFDVRQRWDDHFRTGRVVKAMALPPPAAPQDGPANGAGAGVGGDEAGDRTVLFKYMAFTSPLPVLRNRDFELAVAEEIHADGTAVLKAVSTPVGFLVPPPPPERALRATRMMKTMLSSVKGGGGAVREDPSMYVRGHIQLSGFVARPAPPEGGKPCCEVTYIALVNPMGNIPPMFVNAIIGKQTTALKSLQTFIAANQLPPATGSKVNPVPPKSKL